jgi:hypothetical protein
LRLMTAVLAQARDRKHSSKPVFSAMT